MFTMEIVPGAKAAPMLVRSGLLLNRDLPINPEDLCRFLQLEDTYAMICYLDGVAQGYIVCCKRYMEQQIPELFVLQAVGDGGSAWVTEGWRQLHLFAAKIGCHRIGTIFPVARSNALCRRFGLTPDGVYCTSMVRGSGKH